MVGKTKQHGFTVIELLIAISIFSIIIIMVSAVIIGISRHYQRASFTAQLSEVSRSLHQELSLGIGYQSGVGLIQSSGTDRYICSGKNLYFWKEQSGTSISPPLGLFKRVLKYDETCSGSIDYTSAYATNLLPNGSATGFVQSLSLDSVNGYTNCSKGCSVTTVLKIGTPDMFEGGSVNNRCLSTLNGGDFCSEVTYKSFVKSKVGY